MDINLTLSVDQINKVLEVLVERPYREVVTLVNTIQQQAQRQVDDRAAQQAALAQRDANVADRKEDAE